MLRSDNDQRKKIRFRFNIKEPLHMKEALWENAM